MTRLCESRRLHLVTYENGLAMQESLVALRQRDAIADQLLLLQHTPVITLGRGGRIENLLADRDRLRAAGVQFHETTRGGDITYHGPGQLVGYPILHLGEGNRDIRKYVTKVEEVLLRTVAEFGITATRWEGNRGVWVGRNKIAAIGVRIARWVTSHGFALNVDPNLDHFSLITPCGIQGAGVTSISRLAGRAVTVEEVLPIVERHFSEIFDRDVQPRSHELEIIKAVVHDGAGNVLLLKRREEHGGFWQPVTGRIEPEESTEAAAAREVQEETGQVAKIEPLDLHQSFLVDAAFLRNRDHPEFASERAFAAEIDGHANILLDEEEHEAFGWFTFREACEKIRWSDDRQALEQLEERLMKVSR